MTISEKYVAYIFVQVRKRPKSTVEALNLPAGKLQVYHLKNFGEKTARDQVAVFFGWSTNRDSPFTHRAEFRQAVRSARELGCPLVIAGIEDLLMRTRHDLIAQSAEILDGLAVALLDVSTMLVWKDQEPARKELMIRRCRAESKLRSDRRSAGIRDSNKVKAPSPSRNRLMGSRAVAHKANLFAERHRGFVERLEADLGVAKRLGPSALQRALNDAGMPSASGGSWSKASASNLLKRLRSRAVVKDPSLR